MLRSAQQPVSGAIRKRRLIRFPDRSFKKCVITLDRKLPPSAADASLQAPGGGPADVFVSTGAIRAADQLNHVAEPVIEPCQVRCHPAVPPRMLRSRFPASRALRQQFRITQKERTLTVVL